MATVQRAWLDGCRHCPQRIASLFVGTTDVIGLGRSFRAQRQFSPHVGEHRLDHRRPARNGQTTSLAVYDQEKAIVRQFASFSRGKFVPSKSVVTRTRDYSVLACCQLGRRSDVWRVQSSHSSTFLNCFRFSSLRSFSSSKDGPKPIGDIHDNDHKKSPDSTTSTPSSSLVTSDPPVWTWVERILPLHWQPYARLARLDKPIGTMLLLWPCFWSTAIAAEAGAMPDVQLLALFTVGAVAMRGAGCTINDWWDQDLDRSVARTAIRPLAAGDLSTRDAIAFLALQLSVGLAVLLSLPNTWYCFQWGCLSLPLVALYPATKRFFPYPQAVLGLTFNWGAIMGFAAVHGYVDYSIVAPLYFSGVTWTLVYDTLYAHQDKHDDAKLNLQSTALTFGESEARQRNILHGFGVTTWLAWLMAGYQADLALVPYFAGATAAYGHLLWQINTADLNNPHNLAERFRSNSTVGAILFAALVAGKYFAKVM